MSRAPSWDSMNIFSFDFDCMKIDRKVIDEYKRLKLLNQRGLKEITVSNVNSIFVCCVMINSYLSKKNKLRRYRPFGFLKSEEVWGTEVLFIRFRFDLIK